MTTKKKIYTISKIHNHDAFKKCEHEMSGKLIGTWIKDNRLSENGYNCGTFTLSKRFYSNYFDSYLQAGYELYFYAVQLKEVVPTKKKVVKKNARNLH